MKVPREREEGPWVVDLLVGLGLECESERERERERERLG